MRLRTWLQCAPAFVCVLAATGAHAADVKQRLHALFDDSWERSLRENPITASTLGDHRYDALWPDYSLGALTKQAEQDRAAIAASDAIPETELTPADRLNRNLFRRLYADRVAAYDYGAQYVMVSHQAGAQLLDRLSELLPFASVQDYENWNTRLRTLGPLIDQQITLLRAGVAKHLVQPRIIMERVPVRIEKLIVADPRQSTFYAPLVTMPQSIPVAEQTRLRADAARAIQTEVVPAYRRLLSYMKDEYLPACRESVGIWDTPGGAERYRERIRWHTTTELTADEVHELGLKEVARIRGEMLAVDQKLG
jgi:uncharacterized protein (DUF885 family)